MSRIAAFSLLLAACPVFAQEPNCDPEAGAMDVSCLEEKAPAPVSKAKTSRAALLEYSAEGPRPKLAREGDSATLEICFDLCELYRARRLTRESDLWDLAFLHQYFFDDFTHLEKFRVLYVPLSGPLLKRHAGGCAAANEKERAKCAVNGLAGRLRAEYWLARDDEGFHCETKGRFTEPGFDGKTLCTKYRD